jgi:hypothetical protein
MGTSGARGPPNQSMTVHQSSSAEMADLAAELNALTDLMEAEWNEQRTISTEHARRLGELRKRFERLIAE